MRITGLDYGAQYASDTVSDYTFRKMTFNPLWRYSTAIAYRLCNALYRNGTGIVQSVFMMTDFVRSELNVYLEVDDALIQPSPEYKKQYLFCDAVFKAVSEFYADKRNQPLINDLNHTAADVSSTQLRWAIPKRDALGNRTGSYETGRFHLPIRPVPEDDQAKWYDKLISDIVQA